MDKPVAIITGASQGIGLAIAQELSSSYQLALVSRGIKENHLGRAYPADLSKDPINSLIDCVIDDFGRIDLLVNNAGLCYKQNIEQASLVEWDAALDVNLKAVIHLCHYAIPHLKKSPFGAIINIGSVAGDRAYPGGTNYCATKWGLNGFTQCLFQDLREFGIKVCEIAPGYVNTAMNQKKGLREDLMIQPSDIAQVVRFILNFPKNACPTRIVIQPQLDPKSHA